LDPKNSSPNQRTFHIRDSALVILATNYRAQSLREFRDALLQVQPESIYHHFWGRLLQPLFDEPEYNNDFASWVRHGLHEKALAERLSVITPADFPDIEALRSEVVDTIEERLDESEYMPWSRADQMFYFLRSQLIVLDTGRKVTTPEELGKAIPEIPLGSIFYHFIDARSRHENRYDDFTDWLQGSGKQYEGLCRQLHSIDPYFSALRTIRHRLDILFEEFGQGDGR